MNSKNYIEDMSIHVPQIRNSKLIIHMNGKELAGEELFNEKRFLPPMLNPKPYESYSNIWFIPNVKLTSDMFPSDMSLEDKRKIFIIESRFVTFFQAVRKTGKYQVLSRADSEAEGIPESNIDFILKLIFHTDESFYYDANAYKIIKFERQGKYYITRTQRERRVHYIRMDGRRATNKSPINVSSRDNYNVNIDLYLKKGAHSKVSSIDNVKLSCNQRKEEIWNKWDTLMRVGYKDKISEVNKQLQDSRNNKPLEIDKEEMTKHNQKIKDLISKRKSIIKEKDSYIKNQEIMNRRKKRKSPKPKMLQSRTYYTTARTVDELNKRNDRNDKKKTYDLPEAIPVLETLPDDIEDKDESKGGGRRKTSKRNRGQKKVPTLNYTMKRKVK